MTCFAEKQHRCSIRLRDFDYSSAGAYFVTICTIQRECLFGEVEEGVLQLSAVGRMVEKSWAGMPNHFPRVVLDEYVVMPNHLHGIIIISATGSPVGATHTSPSGPGRQSIGAIVGSFKSAVSKHINQWRDTPGMPVWQRNYYERVIRDDRELDAVRQYIADNPARWSEDENHPQRNG